MAEAKIAINTMSEATLTEYVSTPTSSRVLVLNVGGTILQTLSETLQRVGGALQTLVTDPHMWPHDDEDRLFVDRDPTRFGTLLNWLRDYKQSFRWRISDEMGDELRFWGLYPELLLDKRVGNTVTVNGRGEIIEDIRLQTVRLRGRWYSHRVYNGIECRI